MEFSNNPDLTLTTILLVKNNTKSKFHVHKKILLQCPFFEKCLTNNFKESIHNEILIDITDIASIKVFTEVIMSLYKYPPNIPINEPLDILLEIIKSYNFMGLHFDIMSLHDLVDVNFELLLDIIDYIGYTDEMIQLLIRHLPDKYDLTKFPIELLKEIYSLANKYIIVTVDTESACACYASYDAVLNMQDLMTGVNIKTIIDKKYFPQNYSQHI